MDSDRKTLGASPAVLSGLTYPWEAYFSLFVPPNGASHTFLSIAVLPLVPLSSFGHSREPSSLIIGRYVFFFIAEPEHVLTFSLSPRFSFPDPLYNADLCFCLMPARARLCHRCDSPSIPPLLFLSLFAIGLYPSYSDGTLWVDEFSFVFFYLSLYIDEAHRARVRALNDALWSIYNRACFMDARNFRRSSRALNSAGLASI